MGIAPSECSRMSLWEYDACMEGWQAANSSEDEMPELPEFSEFRAVMERPKPPAIDALFEQMKVNPEPVTDANRT